MNYARLLALKRLDTYGQLAMAIGPVIIVSALHTDSFDALVATYALVGGWQAVSVVATLATAGNEPSWKSPLRKYYHMALILLLFIGFVCMVYDDIILVFLYALLYLTPVMALLYLILSFIELGTLRRAQQHAPSEGTAE